MNQDQILDLHSVILSREPEAYIEGANWLFRKSGIDKKVASPKDAVQYLYLFYLELLNARRTTEAALLLWGKDEIFDPRPRSVQRIWHALDNESKVLIPGAGDQGKSYTPSAWTVLWWTHDPEWTSVKVLSVTASHAAANVMSTIKSFHENSALPLPGRIIHRAIDLGDGNERSSIAMVSIPQGGDVKGRLRGFHPVPRPFSHPLFGKKSRIGVFIDEGEDVPPGLWEGLENILSSETVEDNYHIKIYSGANPKKRESAFAQRCEYPGGWQNFDLEKSQEWYGPEALQKWKVVRLDAARSENVEQKSEEFVGMMTYEGYMNYVRKGVNDPAYYTFARGAWPETSAEFRIISPDFFTNSKGTLTFDSDVVPIASLDPAFAEGGDSAILSTGRYGTVIGFTDENGQFTKITDRHKAIQVEQQFAVQKDLTPIMAQTVMGYLRHLNIRPEWFIMDRTGNAQGLYDTIRVQYGDILGQSWSAAASERKITEEDSVTAEEQYSGVISEMAFAFSIWLQHGYVKFAPMMDTTKLISQSINRRYYYNRGLMAVESKLSFKATASGNSPDEFDSMIMLVHLARLRDAQRAQMVPIPQRVASQRPKNEMIYRPGVVDNMNFVSPI